MAVEESWDDEWSDVEYSDGYGDEDDYYDEDDESETVPCPDCGADVYEDAEQCPSCGQYIIAGATSTSAYVWKGRPIWWIVLGGLGILAVIFGFAMSF